MIDFDNTVLAACMTTFGEVLLYQPAAGVPFSLVGVFNERATNTTYDNGTEIVEARPTLGARASSFPLPPQVNDLVTIRGRLWRVADTTPDGIGHIDLHVMLADDAQANLLPVQPLAPT